MGSCDNEENEKLKNTLFTEPDLSSSHNQIITLYTNNTYDLFINYNAPCGYNKLKLEFDLGEVIQENNCSFAIIPTDCNSSINQGASQKFEA